MTLGCCWCSTWKFLEIQDFPGQLVLALISYVQICVCLFVVWTSHWWLDVKWKCVYVLNFYKQLISLSSKKKELFCKVEKGMISSVVCIEEIKSEMEKCTSRSAQLGCSFYYDAGSKMINIPTIYINQISCPYLILLKNWFLVFEYNNVFWI